MAKIHLDKPDEVKTLREIANSDNVFPYVDYDPNDENVLISITLYRKDVDNSNISYQSREFDEDKDGKLSPLLRKALIQELWKVNPDSTLIDKLKTLGIEVVFAEPQRSGIFRR